LVTPSSYSLSAVWPTVSGSNTLLYGGLLRLVCYSRIAAFLRVLTIPSNLPPALWSRQTRVPIFPDNLNHSSLIPFDDFKALLEIDDREEPLARFCLTIAAHTIEQHCMRRLLVYEFL
jgi:hypothetical protein